jgi:LysR family hca operon transcriptional activator
MELRHLRYFVAVAEEGSVRLAAERRLHTAQPSLSRQIRELEQELGVDLMVRSSRGVTLTSAGHAFLDHARSLLSQAEMAIEAARRVGRAEKGSLTLGFLTGYEMELLGPVLRILQSKLPAINVTIQSQSSPELADGLESGRIDVAFSRPDPARTSLEFRLLKRDPLFVVLPLNHPLARKRAIHPRALEGQTFVTVGRASAPALRRVIDAYLAPERLSFTAVHEAGNLSMAISLILSTAGVGLLPMFTRNLFPSSVVGRPLAGTPPSVDLVMGVRRGSQVPIVDYLLSRVEELASRLSDDRDG